MKILYFGAFTPDRPEYKTAASSTAGNLFQINFLTALGRSRLPMAQVFSYLPMPSFPKHRKLFFLGGKDQLSDGTPVRFLPFINLGAIKILTLGISCFFKTLQWARQNRTADRRIVIAYNLNAPPAWPIWLACKWTKSEFVPFIGDIYVPGEVIGNSWLRRREFEAQKRIIPKADGLLVANHAIVEDFAAGRDSLLLEGGVPESYLDSFGASSSNSEGVFHVVFAGQLSQLNGVTLLLEALKKIDSPNFRFTIAGSGELNAVVENAANHDSRIQFLGLIPHSELTLVYKTADLVLSLRRTDNQTHRYVFPSKIVECLATGRALLTSCTGHAKAEFGEFAYLLPDETPEALATEILRIASLGISERKKIGEAAQGYVRKHRTWESNVIRLEEYLQTSRRAA